MVCWDIRFSKVLRLRPFPWCKTIIINTKASDFVFVNISTRYGIHYYCRKVKFWPIRWWKAGEGSMEFANKKKELPLLTKKKNPPYHEHIIRAMRLL